LRANSPAADIQRETKSEKKIAMNPEERKAVVKKNKEFVSGFVELIDK
jgi:hypothetical protein